MDCGPQCRHTMHTFSGKQIYATWVSRFHSTGIATAIGLEKLIRYNVKRTHGKGAICQYSVALMFATCFSFPIHVCAAKCCTAHDFAFRHCIAYLQHLFGAGVVNRCSAECPSPLNIVVRISRFFVMQIVSRLFFFPDCDHALLREMLQLRLIHYFHNILSVSCDGKGTPQATWGFLKEVVDSFLLG